MRYETYTLRCGLRVILQPVASPVVFCGYAINAGSRDEEPGDEGLAHFCEHATFKGTSRRRSVQVLNTLERVGGDLNAFTNKQDTVYYAAFLAEHLPRAVDLLTDIVLHSTYPQSELDKEKTVICEEIESYNDTPAELIYDEFENVLFQGHPLGHHILGSAERVRQFTTADALRFTQRYYRPDNMVFFASGNIDFGRLVRLLERATADMPAATPLPTLTINQTLSQEEDTSRPLPLAPCPPQFIRQNHNTHQAHVMAGTIAYPVCHPLRIPLYLLNNIMGGPAMNSRFNLSLRERRGLVYGVESNMVCFADTGVWSVYFGCDPHDVKRCLRAVRREQDRMRTTLLSPAQLTAAKRQLKGQLGVASDSRESFTLSIGKSFLHYGDERDLSVLFQRIDAVSAEQVRAVAQEIFDPSREVVLCFG
ncbi:MAG: insulinase family protein [Prevotella sp.]|nr:insulinase family protein [Prevotella sp.]